MNLITFDFPWTLGDTDFAGIGVMAPEDMGRISVEVPDERLLSVMTFLTKRGFNPTHEMA